MNECCFKCVVCGTSRLRAKKPKKPNKKILLDIYDAIHVFGNREWKRIEWAQTFNLNSWSQSAARRLIRMDKFCDTWGVEIQKRTAREVSGSRTLNVLYRRFTAASRTRVDYLLGPVVQEHNTPEQDVLQSTLGAAPSELQDSAVRGLRNASLGKETLGLHKTVVSNRLQESM